MGSASVQQNICFLTIFAILVTTGILNPLSAQQKPTRQSSLEAFSKGDYDLAYSELSELLTVYPRDPLYKYYSGICLVNLERDPVRATGLLQEALQEAAIFKSIPPDAIFWLGRAQHMAGSFVEAVDSYTAFTEQSGKKAAKELKVPIYIQQCIEKKGNLSQIEPEAPLIGSEQADNKISEKNDSLTDQPDIQIPVNKIVVRESISGDYDQLLSEALRYQMKADSLQKIIETQKSALDKLTYREKTDLRIIIAVTENLADSLQNLADMRFAEAQDIMNKTPFVAAEENRDTSEKLQVTPEKDTTAGKDSIPPALSEIEPVKVPEEKPARDTSAVEVKNVIPSQAVKPENIYSYFEIIPKPVYREDDRIQVNPEIPPGLIYRIQIAVFRNPVAPSYFKGISPVFGFKMTGKDLTVYHAGMFRRLADANKALAAVKQKGFKDAFVASFLEGKAVSSERAAILEKEWGRKPLVSTSSGIPETPSDTIPPTLSFRVEVQRSTKPLKDEVVEGIRKMAGTRGLETLQLDDGTIVYLIGMFITYESAEEYTDLLVRNGYREARITAWLGKKEIPVETARELFERLK